MRKTRMLGIVLVLVLTVSLIPFGVFKANAEGGSTAPTIEKPVYVTVTDANGTPKAGATVQVLDSDGTVVQTISNAGESFTVFLPQGTYSLMVSDAPSGFVPNNEASTVTVLLTEAEEKDDIPANTFHDYSHTEYCGKTNHVGLEMYTVYDDNQEITAYCFNQNYDNPYISEENAVASGEFDSYNPNDHLYKRLVGTPELLYSLAQCKWLGPDGTGISAQELYDHILSIIYHRDYIKNKYGFDDTLTDYLLGRAIKQYTDGEFRAFKANDEDGNPLLIRKSYPNGAPIYDENGYYQWKPGGNVLGSVVGHAQNDNGAVPGYVFPQEFKDAWHELIEMTDHPDDYYLYIYYPHNFMTKEAGVASGWYVPAHYDPEFYYYASVDQCLMSIFEVPPVRTTLKLLEATTVEITKTWADENDQDGCRPTADEYTAMVKLYADGTDVTEAYEATRTVIDNGDNTYTVKFADLPKMDGEHEIVYTIRESNVPNYTADKTEAANGEVITNRHTPEPTEISITKEWEDGENADGVRPDSITVRLFDGETEVKSATVTPDANGNWSYTFTGLPKYKDHGTPIEYKVEEDPVPEYDTLVVGYKITNKHTPEPTEITVTKEWKDNANADGVRPESITVRLFADGTEVKSVTITPDETGAWSYTFKNLPKNKNGREIKYTIKEDPVPEYQAEIENYKITNTHVPVVEIPIEKKWDDADDQDGVRPKNITVLLYADETKVQSATVVPDANGNWKYTFKNLPKFKDDGSEIVYTIDEETVPAYDKKIEGYIITNKHEPEKTNVNGKKTWQDDYDHDAMRPKSITIRLFANGKEIKSVKVTEADGWKWSFTDLPKYEKGKEIKYTIKEDRVLGYTAKVVGYNVINSYSPPTGDASQPELWIALLAISLLTGIGLLVLEWINKRTA